jgi:hypothetical protein
MVELALIVGLPFTRLVAAVEQAPLDKVEVLVVVVVMAQRLQFPAAA